MINNMVPNLSGKKISIIFEGMGEASYNIENCFAAFDMIYPELSEQYAGIVLRISSSGNISFCEKYMEYYISRKEKYSDVTFRFNYHFIRLFIKKENISFLISAKNIRSQTF